MNMSTRQCRPQQTGGTALGLIIGVVFGLAAALAVAVYVTKVPVPFVNKGQTRSADQDAAEAKKNKDWDPNAPLHGKTPLNPGKAVSAGSTAPATVPVAPAVSGQTDGGVAASPTVRADAAKPGASAAKTETRPVTVATPAPPAVPATPPSAAGDPLGDLARAKSSNSGAEPFSYFVQVGAYRTADDAEAQRARLSLSGVEARVTEREQSGRAVFRVRAGPFDKKEDADRIKEKLELSGQETALVRVQR